MGEEKGGGGGEGERGGGRIGRGRLGGRGWDGGASGHPGANSPVCSLSTMVSYFYDNCYVRFDTYC